MTSLKSGTLYINKSEYGTPSGQTTTTDLEKNPVFCKLITLLLEHLVKKSAQS